MPTPHGLRRGGSCVQLVITPLDMRARENIHRSSARPLVSMQHQLRPRTSTMVTSSAIKAVPDQDKSIQDLRLELAVALKEEDYSLAARLRDTMQQMQVVDKLAVEDANRSFYTAFMAGSVQQMAEVWGEGDHVQVCSFRYLLQVQ